MDEKQIKLDCLKLARPDGVMNPDAYQIIGRAEAFYEFVTRPEMAATYITADKATAPAQKLVAKPPRT